MGILDRLLPAKAAITSSTIRAEIDRANDEITAHRAKITTAESTIATLDDDAHVRVIENNAALGRAIARLNLHGADQRRLRRRGGLGRIAGGQRQRGQCQDVGCAHLSGPCTPVPT